MVLFQISNSNLVGVRRFSLREAEQVQPLGGQLHRLAVVGMLFQALAPLQVVDGQAGVACRGDGHLAAPLQQQRLVRFHGGQAIVAYFGKLHVRGDAERHVVVRIGVPLRFAGGLVVFIPYF